MKLTLRVFSMALLLLASVSFVGCGDSQTTPTTSSADEHDHDEHDHDGESHGEESTDDHPETFAAAMKELEELHSAIQTAFEANDLEQADGPVHAIGHLLEELPELAAKESGAEDAGQKVEQAVDALMESFGAIDERLHGGESAGKAYEDVANEIEESFKALKAIQQVEK